VSGWSTTSIAPRFLVALLDADGIDVADLLGAAGIAREDLAAPDMAMPLDAFRALWARAAATHPDIGLTLVERFPPGQMHVLVHLAMRSATVEGALGDVCRYATVTSPADRLGYERRGEIAQFNYATRAPGPPNPWIAEHYLAMAVLFFANACGRPLPIRAVTFAAPAQAPLAAYVRRFGVEPQFSAPANALEFDADALAWPLRSHDAYLHAILERVAQARRAPAPDSVLDTAQAAIARALLGGATPAIDAIAAACKLTPRALRDRLARVPTNFRKLLDEVRRDLAREHLARGLSVTETAYLLGFSEPAAFQHACRRWFGQSAGDVRRGLVDPH
jgi:AraC-like DNA-binding protein